MTSYVETITGVDGNDITLYIHRPDTLSGTPAVHRAHPRWRHGDPPGERVRATSSGATTSPPRDSSWSVSSSATAGGEHGPHPFPAGLNDCAAPAVGDRQPGVTRRVEGDHVGRVGWREPLARDDAQGEAGRWIDASPASTPSAPTSLGQYADPPLELTSLVENDGYFLDIDKMGASSRRTTPRLERHQSAGVAETRATVRPRGPAPARDLGERARPAARRGPGLLPQAARRRRVRRGPDGERHVPRR